MDRSLRAARVATFVYFVLDGSLVGIWLVQIPVVEKRAGISNATLGSLLVLLGLGAFIGMHVAGRLADRVGTRVIVPPPACCAPRPSCYPALPAIPGRWQAHCWSSASATAAST